MTAQEALDTMADLLNDISHHMTDVEIFCSEEVEQAFKMATDKLEKEIPKKPKEIQYKPLLNYGWKYECPSCGIAVGYNENDGNAYTEESEYCGRCGQKLDWEG